MQCCLICKNNTQGMQKKKINHLLQRQLQSRTSAQHQMMVGNPQKQDVDLLHPRSILSTHPCWKPSGVESRTALASRAMWGPGARSCCSLSSPAALLQNTAKSEISVQARGSLHISARTTISHGREEEGQAASDLVECGVLTPPNTRWFWQVWKRL